MINQMYSDNLLNKTLRLLQPKRLAVLLYSGLAPFHFFPLGPHSGEEVHQLLLVLQVGVASEVLTPLTPCQVLLVLRHLLAASLARPI